MQALTLQNPSAWTALIHVSFLACKYLRYSPSIFMGIILVTAKIVVSTEVHLNNRLNYCQQVLGGRPLLGQIVQKLRLIAFLRPRGRLHCQRDCTAPTSRARGLGSHCKNVLILRWERCWRRQGKSFRSHDTHMSMFTIQWMAPCLYLAGLWQIVAKRQRFRSITVSRKLISCYPSMSNIMWIFLAIYLRMSSSILHQGALAA